MKPELARVFWASGYWLNLDEHGNLHIRPMPHKKGRVNIAYLLELRDDKDYWVKRLREEGDCHALGLDKPLHIGPGCVDKDEPH